MGEIPSIGVGVHFPDTAVKYESCSKSNELFFLLSFWAARNKNLILRVAFSHNLQALYFFIIIIIWDEAPLFVSLLLTQKTPVHLQPPLCSKSVPRLVYNQKKKKKRLNVAVKTTALLGISRQQNL